MRIPKNGMAVLSQLNNIMSKTQFEILFGQYFNTDKCNEQVNSLASQIIACQDLAKAKEIVLDAVENALIFAAKVAAEPKENSHDL